MKTNIENFLEELYEIDPSLTQKKDQIEKLVQTMMSLTPNVTLDESFKSNLRMQIGEKIKSEKLKNYTYQNKPNIFQILTYIFGGAGVAAIGFFVFQQEYISQPQNITTKEIISQTPVAFSSQVIQAQANSFGKLNSVGIDQNAKGGMGGGGSAAPQLQTESLVATSDAVSVDTSARKLAGGGGGIEASSMPMVDPMPEYIPEIIRYTFSGSLNLDIPETMTVYKKENQKNDSSSFANILKSINFGGVNLANFSNLKISSLSTNEDKDMGYALNLDFDNGALSIWKNWAKWPTIDYSQPQPNIIISEDEAKRIANEFLQQYNIDLSNYGSPILDESYKNMLARNREGAMMSEFYLGSPALIYPLLVDGKEIKEEYGQYAGVRVEIDAQNKKVSNVSGLSVNTFIASDYSVENNEENILKIANVGGRWGMYDYGTQEVKEINFTLKNPKIIYINSYSYKNNTQEQYVVPAVSFEVEKPEGDQYQYYAQTVTVPLVKDMYKYDELNKITGSAEQ